MYYRAKASDSCQALAWSHGITVDQLRNWNPNVSKPPRIRLVLRGVESFVPTLLMRRFVMTRWTAASSRRSPVTISELACRILTRRRTLSLQSPIPLRWGTVSASMATKFLLLGLFLVLFVLF